MREGLDALVAVDDQPSRRPACWASTWAGSTATTSGSCFTACEPPRPTGYAGWRPHAVTSRWCVSCTRRWRDTLDQAVDMYGDRHRKLVETHLDDMLKAQRQAVDRIVHRYHRLGAVLLDPDVADDELRARLLSTVPEAQLREDQSDLANWTRGDRKARIEQTAERHAGLSQFAGPFLSTMKFVDEQGEGASPTLSALRAYREHRPPDAPPDFAPAALQPLIRHDGVTEPHRPVLRGVPRRPRHGVGRTCRGSTASRRRTSSRSRRAVTRSGRRGSSGPASRRSRAQGSLAARPKGGPGSSRCRSRRTAGPGSGGLSWPP